MSLPVTSEDAVYRNSELEALARAVKPARVRSKKGKRFADGSFMLSLADQINRREEERIQGLLQEEARLLKLVAKRGTAKAQRARPGRKEKLEAMKRKLRGAKGSAGGSKGERGQAPEGSKRPRGADKKTVRFR